MSIIAHSLHSVARALVKLGEQGIVWLFVYLFEAAQTNATTGTYEAAKVTYERVPPSIVQNAELEINRTYQVRHKSHQPKPCIDPFENGRRQLIKSYAYG